MVARDERSGYHNDHNAEGAWMNCGKRCLGRFSFIQVIVIHEGVKSGATVAQRKCQPALGPRDKVTGSTESLGFERECLWKISRQSVK